MNMTRTYMDKLEVAQYLIVLMRTALEDAKVERPGWRKLCRSALQHEKSVHDVVFDVGGVR